jgi:hypothetical protein
VAEVTTYEIVPGLVCHAVELAANMRQADIDEVWAAGHVTPLQSLLQSVEGSRDTFAGLADGKVVCMFGVGTTTLISDVAIPWLLGSADLPKHSIAFLRANKARIQEMKQNYKVMRNFVDARNHKAIRWLKWLGFDILPPQSFGADKMPFHPFQYVRE